MKLTRNSLKELIRQSIDELKEDAGDMDNDGVNEPDDEEYLDNKDKAIKKAIKNETQAAPGELDNNDDEKIKPPHGSQHEGIGGGVVGIPALGDMIRGK